MERYFIAAASVYGILFVPLYLTIIISALYQIYRRVKNKKKNFALVVHSWIVLYSFLKLCFISLQISSLSVHRKIYLLRGLAAAFDTTGVEVLISLLDIIVLTWAQINVNIGGDKEKGILVAIAIAVAVKSVIVYLVVIAFVIVITHDFDSILSYSLQIASGATCLIGLIIFLGLFAFMTNRTRQYFKDSANNNVQLAYRKLMTTFIIVSVFVGLTTFAIIGGHAVFTYTVFVGISDAANVLQDVFVFFINLLPMPAIFWLIFVTYSEESIVTKMLSKRNSQQGNTDI